MSDRVRAGGTMPRSIAHTLPGSPTGGGRHVPVACGRSVADGGGIRHAVDRGERVQAALHVLDARQRERGAPRATIAVGLGRRVGRRRGGGLARPVRAASRHARRGARSVPGGDDRHLRRIRVLGRIVVQGVGRPHAWHDADHDRRGLLRRPPRRAAVCRRGLARQRPNQRGDGRMAGMGDDRRHAGGAASRPRGVAAHSCAAAGLQRDVGWRAARLHRLASAAVPADVPPAHQPVDRRVDRAGHPCAGLHCDRRAALGHATDDWPRGRRLCRSGLCDVGDVADGARVSLR